MRLPALLTVLWLACAAAAAEGAPVAACLSGLKRALVAGGFSGSVDCARDRLTARPVGHIDVRGHRFALYDYRYQLALMCPECAVHGGRRVIVLRDGVYLGQYQTNLMRARVAHGALVLAPDGWPVPPGEYAGPVAIRFTAKGPPRAAHVGGEDLEFFK